MKHILFVTLLACGSSPPPPVAPPPAAPPPPSSTGGATYGSVGAIGVGEGSGDPGQFGSGNKPVPKCSELHGPGLCADDRPAAEHGHGPVIHGGGIGTVTAGRYPTVGHGSGAPTPHTVEKIAIRNAIKQHFAGIRTCYEKLLESQATIEGGIAATFTIEPDGHVSESTATGFDPTVAACIAAEIKTIAFPVATSKTVVNYPFNFRPQN